MMTGHKIVKMMGQDKIVIILGQDEENRMGQDKIVLMIGQDCDDDGTELGGVQSGIQV